MEGRGAQSPKRESISESHPSGLVFRKPTSVGWHSHGGWGIPSWPLLGLENILLVSRSAWESQFLLTGNLEGKLKQTRRLGQHRKGPWLTELPFLPSPTLASRPFGEQSAGTQAGQAVVTGTFFRSGPDFCRTLGGEVSWRNCTQVRNGPVSRGRIQKIDCDLSDSHQNENPSTCSLGALNSYVSKNATLWETLILNSPSLFYQGHLKTQSLMKPKDAV